MRAANRVMTNINAGLAGHPPQKEPAMTGFVDTVAGIGHNQPDPMEMEKKNQKWERWAK